MNSPDSRAIGRARRRLLAVGAVAACVPYVTLKVAWMTGFTIGLSGGATLFTPTMEVANAVTLGLELVAAGLAIALAGRWRWRVPAWLFGLVFYVGTGLLGGILVLLPVAFAMQWVAPPTAASTPAVIEGWVYLVVYAGFCLLGLCLLTLCAWHAWERWVLPWGWQRPLSSRAPVPSRVRQIALAHGGAMVVVAILAIGIEVRADLLSAHSVMALAMALLCLGGSTMLSLRRPVGLPGAVPLAMMWIGSAAVATWATYLALLLGIENPLVAGGAPMALVGLEVVHATVGWLTIWLLRGFVARHRSAPAAHGSTPLSVGAS
ncbi:MAG: hypothetical protein V9G08_00345 [Dermatophilaceae bacterium]